MLKQGRRSPNWAFMEKFEVPDYDNPERNYLTRYRILSTPWFGVQLHRFDGPDPRPTVHDHPWDFASFVLLGGYLEVTPNGKNIVRLFNKKKATDLHYIKNLLRTPTWTLMFVGKRKRRWGYMEDGEWTDAEEHRYAKQFDAAIDKRRKMD